MVGQGGDERDEVADVVEDVVADDDVGRADLAGHVGPEPLDLAVGDPLLLGQVGEGGQHPGALVDGGDRRRRRAQRQAGRSPAGPDVEERAAVR